METTTRVKTDGQWDWHSCCKMLVCISKEADLEIEVVWDWNGAWKRLNTDLSNLWSAVPNTFVANFCTKVRRDKAQAAREKELLAVPWHSEWIRQYSKLLTPKWMIGIALYLNFEPCAIRHEGKWRNMGDDETDFHWSIQINPSKWSNGAGAHEFCYIWRCAGNSTKLVSLGKAKSVSWRCKRQDCFLKACISIYFCHIPSQWIQWIHVGFSGRSPQPIRQVCRCLFVLATVWSLHWRMRSNWWLNLGKSSALASSMCKTLWLDERPKSTKRSVAFLSQLQVRQASEPLWQTAKKVRRTAGGSPRRDWPVLEFLYAVQVRT